MLRSVINYFSDKSNSKSLTEMQTYRMKKNRLVALSIRKIKTARKDTSLRYILLVNQVIEKGKQPTDSTFSFE